MRTSAGKDRNAESDHLFLSICLEMRSCRSYREFKASRCLFCASGAELPPKSGGKNALSSGESGGVSGVVCSSVALEVICDSVSKSSNIPNLSTQVPQNEIFTKKSRKGKCF